MQRKCRHFFPDGLSAVSHVLRAPRMKARQTAGVAMATVNFAVVLHCNKVLQTKEALRVFGAVMTASHPNPLAFIPDYVERKGSLFLRSDHMDYGRPTLVSNW